MTGIFSCCEGGTEVRMEGPAEEVGATVLNTTCSDTQAGLRVQTPGTRVWGRPHSLQALALSELEKMDRLCCSVRG